MLKWLQSQSCRYKVFVGSRVADIQELTEDSPWRYVRSGDNPADDITRGLTLSQLLGHNRWSHGPPFLRQKESSWPSSPDISSSDDPTELRTANFCGHISVTPDIGLPDVSVFTTYNELLEASVKACQGAAANSDITADDYKQAELTLFRKVQRDCFPEEFALLSSQKPVPASSRLLTLAPEYDQEAQLIHVRGRLRRCDQLDQDTLHPVVLDPHHHITKLIIQDFDGRLAHPGPERGGSYADGFGSYVEGRPSGNISITVPNVRDGAVSPLSPKWLTFHPPVYGSTGHRSTQQVWTASDPTSLKWGGARRSAGA